MSPEVTGSYLCGCNVFPQPFPSSPQYLTCCGRFPKRQAKDKLQPKWEDESNRERICVWGTKRYRAQGEIRILVGSLHYFRMWNCFVSDTFILSDFAPRSLHLACRTGPFPPCLPPPPSTSVSAPGPPPSSRGPASPPGSHQPLPLPGTIPSSPLNPSCWRFRSWGDPPPLLGASPGKVQTSTFHTVFFTTCLLTDLSPHT